MRADRTAKVYGRERLAAVVRIFPPNDGGRRNPTLALFLVKGRSTLELDLAFIVNESSMDGTDDQGDIVRERQLSQVANLSFGPSAVSRDVVANDRSAIASCRCPPSADVRGLVNDWQPAAPSAHRTPQRRRFPGV